MKCYQTILKQSSVEITVMIRARERTSEGSSATLAVIPAEPFPAKHR